MTLSDPQQGSSKPRRLLMSLKTYRSSLNLCRRHTSSAPFLKVMA